MVTLSAAPGATGPSDRGESHDDDLTPRQFFPGPPGLRERIEQRHLPVMA